MSFYSIKCESCTEKSKRQYTQKCKDERGKVYDYHTYDCDNCICEVKRMCSRKKFK